MILFFGPRQEYQNIGGYINWTDSPITMEIFTNQILDDIVILVLGHEIAHAQMGWNEPHPDEQYISAILGEEAVAWAISLLRIGMTKKRYEFAMRCFQTYGGTDDLLLQTIEMMKERGISRCN